MADIYHMFNSTVHSFQAANMEISKMSTRSGKDIICSFRKNCYQ